MRSDRSASSTHYKTYQVIFVFQELFDGAIEIVVAVM